MAQTRGSPYIWVTWLTMPVFVKWIFKMVLKQNRKRQRLPMDDGNRRRRTVCNQTIGSLPTFIRHAMALRPQPETGVYIASPEQISAIASAPNGDGLGDFWVWWRRGSLSQNGDRDLMAGCKWFWEGHVSLLCDPQV